MKVFFVLFFCCWIFLPSFTMKVLPFGINPKTCPNYPNCPLPAQDNKIPLGFPFYCPNFPFCYENHPSEVATKYATKTNTNCHYADLMCVSYVNNTITTLEDKTDASACEEACKGFPKCTHFTFTKYFKHIRCDLLSSCSIKKRRCASEANCASGVKECTCPQLDKKPGVGVARWSCQDGLDPYQKSSPVGTKCTISCSSWSTNKRNPQQQTKGLTLQSTCLPGMTWSTTTIDTSKDTNLAVSTYYKWPQPDEADPQCDDACTDLGPFTSDPNSEEGAEFTCEGWSSDAFNKPGGFIIRSGDVCQLRCNNEIVERLSCKEGRWTANPGEGFYCFNKPELPKQPTTTTTSTTTITTAATTPARKWKTVFSHDTAGGLFRDETEAKNMNPDDNSAKLFSILGQLEDMKRDDGVFHFKLCYPELLDPIGRPFPCNEWKQTSNPVTDKDITGYDPIKITFKKGSTKGEFGGLGVSPASRKSCFIDDVPDHRYWWNCVGAYRYHPKKPTIPGPVAGPKGTAVTKVVLYLYL